MARHDWDEYKKNWKSDPKLRAMTNRILSMPVEDRLRQIEEEANFFASVRPIPDDPSTSTTDKHDAMTPQGDA